VAGERFDRGRECRNGVELLGIWLKEKDFIYPLAHFPFENAIVLDKCE
jgi:hypothetical protein